MPGQIRMAAVAWPRAWASATSGHNRAAAQPARSPRSASAATSRPAGGGQAGLGAGQVAVDREAAGDRDQVFIALGGGEAARAGAGRLDRIDVPGVVEADGEAASRPASRAIAIARALMA
jgi:hypothetical protein